MDDDKKVERVLEVLENGKYRNGWNKCQYCGSTNLEVKNFDRMWGDGDVMCIDCGEYVRSFNSG